MIISHFALIYKPPFIWYLITRNIQEKYRGRILKNTLSHRGLGPFVEIRVWSLCFALTLQWPFNIWVSLLLPVPFSLYLFQVASSRSLCSFLHHCCPSHVLRLWWEQQHNSCLHKLFVMKDRAKGERLSRTGIEMQADRDWRKQPKERAVKGPSLGIRVSFSELELSNVAQWAFLTAHGDTSARRATYTSLLFLPFQRQPGLLFDPAAALGHWLTLQCPELCKEMEPKMLTENQAWHPERGEQKQSGGEGTPSGEKSFQDGGDRLGQEDTPSQDTAEATIQLPNSSEREGSPEDEAPKEQGLRPSIDYSSLDKDGSPSSAGEEMVILKRAMKEAVSPAGEKRSADSLMGELSELVQNVVKKSSWWERHGIDGAIITMNFFILPVGKQNSWGVWVLCRVWFLSGFLTLY